MDVFFVKISSSLSVVIWVNWNEVIYVFANIPYLLVVHHPHKLGGHNYP